MTRRVLIVDDHKEVRKMLRAGLESLEAGIQVVDVPSGEEAMLLLSSQTFDLLVADVRLPGISGLELKQRVMGLNPQMKLIIVTGMTDPAIRREVSESGADVFFIKPIELGEFLDSAVQCLALPVGENKPVVQKSPVPEVTPATPVVQGTFFERIVDDLRAVAVFFRPIQDPVRLLAGKLPEGWTAPELDFNRSAQQSFGKAAFPALLYLPGAGLDLGAVQLGERGWLGVLLPSVSNAKGMSEALSALWQASLEIFAGRESLPQIEEPHPVEATLPPPPELEALFAPAASEQLKGMDIDAFWDSLAEESEKERPSAEGMLSYEEARRLGLGPKDEA